MWCLWPDVGLSGVRKGDFAFFVSGHQFKTLTHKINNPNGKFRIGSPTAMSLLKKLFVVVSCRSAAPSFVVRLPKPWNYLFQLREAFNKKNIF